ncbi:unnamed protein product [Rhizophagus irregularis]|nr:unnamed protein product [Rhizophagus irregularis]
MNKINESTTNYKSNKLFTSKIYQFKNLPEPKNATEAFHSNNSYDHFNIPDNINDFNSSSNQSYDSISKASSILKDDNEELSKSFNELQVNSNEDNQTNYVKEIVEQQQIKNMFNVDDEDEIYDDKNFHSEEQDELEIPDEGF